MITLSLKGLPLLNPLTFPINHTNYKKSNKKYNAKEYFKIEKKEIENHPFFIKNLEKQLSYL